MYQNQEFHHSGKSHTAIRFLPPFPQHYQRLDAVMSGNLHNHVLYHAVVTGSAWLHFGSWSGGMVA